jgi:hypothetical protein
LGSPPYEVKAVIKTAIHKGDLVMKTQRLTSILGSSLVAGALTIGALATTQSASAQSNTAVGQATIPFAFQTDKRTLPAGTYRIDVASSHILRLKGPGNAGGFIVMNDAYKTNTPTRGSMVFDRYGDQYFLRQVWVAGSGHGYECPKGRAEKGVLQAKNRQSPDSTELAFNAKP